MYKELEALNKIAGITNYDGGKNLKALGNSHKKEFNLLEKALKEKEQQDEIIKIIKEIISFKASEPEFEMDEDDSVRSIIGRVYLELKRAITNNERELFRNWVLETCFPKELKALEIIKEKGLDIREFRYASSLYEYNICKNVGCKELTQEEYDLLKDVLYNNRYEDKEKLE